MLIWRTRRFSARNPRRLWPAALSALGLVLTIALFTAAAAFAAPPVAGDLSVTVKENRTETIFPIFSDPDGDDVTIIGHTDPPHGSVTCGEDSCAYTPDLDYLGADSFDYTVFDGTDADTGTISITVVENQAPVAFDQTVAVKQNVPKDILLDFLEPDGDEVTVTIGTGPAHGDVVCSGDPFEPCVYTPDTGYVGPDSFDFTVSDGTADTTATVSITVAPNNPPVALDDAVSVTPGMPKQVFPRSNDEDADEDLLTITANTQPGDGAVSCTASSCTYTPDAAFTGSDSFGYTVSDGIDTDTATVFLSVGVTGPPVANDDTLRTKRNTSGTVLPIENDEDPDDDPLMIESETDGADGTVTCTEFSCTYVPDPGFVGADSFSYTVTDGTGDDTAIVHVTVVLNSPPVAVDDSLTTKRNKDGFVSPLGNDTDADEEDELLITGVAQQPANGEATCGFTSCTYTPNTDFLGTDSFDYTVSDGTDTDVGTVNVNVVPNSPPVAQDEAIETEANTPVSFTPTVTDADRDVLTLTGATDPPHGTATCGAGGSFSCTYTPDLNYAGPDSFDYTVSDDDGATDTATVTVTVLPSAEDDVVVTPRNTPVDFNVLANDVGVVGATTVTVDEMPTHGAVTCANSGACTYTPDLGFTGGDHFEYTVEVGSTSDSAHVFIRVTAPTTPGPGGPLVLAGIDAEDGGLGGHGPINVYIDLANSILANVENGGSGILVIGGTQVGCDPREFWDAIGAGTGRSVTYVGAAEIPGQSFAGFAMIAVVSSQLQTACGLTNAENNAFAARRADIKAFVNGGGGLFGTSQDGLTAPYGYLEDFGEFTFRTGLGYSNITPTPAGLAAGITNELDICCWHDEYLTFPNWMNVLARNVALPNNAAALGGTSTVVGNEPPVANNDSITTQENVAKDFNLTATDPEGAPLTFIVVTQPTNGAVTCSTAGACTYTPNAGFSGSDSFTFKANDGQLDSNVATISITVEPAANRAPDAVNDSLTTPEDTPGTVNVLANDSDPDGDALTVTGETDGTNGTVSCTPAGECTYTPAVNFNGTDSFTYTISDGNGGTDTATVNVTVTPVNDPPNAVNDSLTTPEDTPGTVDVLANDSDPDGDALTVTGKTDGAHGTVSCTTAGVCTYTPAANFNGSDSFTYTISDGNGGTDTATVNVTVTPVNDPPNAANDAFTTPEDTPGSVNVLANDSDPDGDALTVTASTNGAHGSVSCTAAGVCTYTPAVNFNGSDSFTYTVSDGNGGTDTATVNVTVTPVNDPPNAVNDTLTTAQNTAGSVNVLANDSDPDGDTLTVTAQTNGTNGTVSCTAGGSCTYTPNAGFSGTDSFTYTISDGNGGTDTAIVNVTVTGVNAPPDAVNDSLTTPEDTPGTVNVLANDSDPDGDTLTVIGDTDGDHGTVSCTTAGVCTYTPAVNFHGSDSFTYTVSDGNGGTDTATVNVTVTPVNDPPNAVNDSLTTPEDTAGAVNVLANDSDPDGDTLTVTGSTNGAHGTVSCTTAGVCTYTPAANFNGSDSFTYTISDGNGGTDTATVNVTVTPVNDPPNAANDAFTTPEDTPGTVNVLANDSDPDGDALTVTASTNGAHGSVSCTAAGVCTYTPAVNFNGSDSFTYTVSDGNGGTDTATVNVTVTPVNDPPNAVNDTLTTAQNTAGTVNVLANDSDPDGDTLTVTAQTNGTNGTVTCTAGGSCTYTPNAGFSGTDSFTYTISDGNGGTDTATVNVTVTPSGPTCNGLRATFVGGPGNTNFQGGPGVDVVVDLGGDNYIQSGGGNDHICLGNGKDEIDSGDGNDFVDAGGGQNKIKTGNGDDIARAGTGDDDIDTGNGNDSVLDLGGKNKIVTGNGNDAVISGLGDDEIDTGNGDDLVMDAGGHNIVKTDNGNDMITTGAGNDKIDGGNGFDVCSAGAGRNEVKDCELST